MPTIIAVRHAESIANTKGVYQGQTYDTDLSPLGRNQAKSLAEQFVNRKIDNIISSPLKRTYQTALEISKISNIPIETNGEITETNHGIWEGRSKKWVESKCTDVYVKWLSKPKDVFFPGGEAFINTVHRIERFILRRSWYGNNVIVTHDNVVRILVCIAKKCSINDLWKTAIEPAAISIFKVDGLNGKKRLKAEVVNDNRHLKNIQTNINVHAL
ncbi:MAG: histidine phosphatase family protein [Candidatus Hodarchaeales archaeon]